MVPPSENPVSAAAKKMPFRLPVPPSPNLRTDRAVELYPSLCLFEGTILSVGRGTDRPFECFGHPDLLGKSGYDFRFTPRPMAGAKAPLLEGELCGGVDLRGEDDPPHGLSLSRLVAAFRAMERGDAFFTPMFEKLIGVDYVRRMMLEGASADEIEARWRDDAERFRERRRLYLLYAE